VGTFWLARAYERTSHKLTVIPMAYSRAQPGKVARVEFGYFVAETSDRIFFASLPSEGKHLNELREFPRSETDDLEVGNLTPAGQAQVRAARFAYNLCTRSKAVPSAASPNQSSTPLCSTTYITQLKQMAKVGP
jgi:hypothetical protein